VGGSGSAPVPARNGCTKGVEITCSAPCRQFREGRAKERSHMDTHRGPSKRRWWRGDASCVRVPVIVPRRLRFAAIGLLVALPAVALGARALFRRAEPAPARAGGHAGHAGRSVRRPRRVQEGDRRQARRPPASGRPHREAPSPRVLKPTLPCLRAHETGGRRRHRTLRHAKRHRAPGGRGRTERRGARRALPGEHAAHLPHRRRRRHRVERIVGVQPEERIALAIGDVEGRVCPRM
jgi:hypothetical protein